MILIGQSVMIILSLVLGLAINACGDSKFNKGTTSNTTPVVLETQSKQQEAIPAVASTIPVPSGAIVKGSFTVYTEPKIPAPFQSYLIFIKVKLPSGTGVTYSKEDLTIDMTGTDGYKDNFPQVSKKFNRPAEGKFSISGDEATVVMKIPGAESNIKDTIYGSSRLLQESQMVELIFTKQ